MSSLDLDKLVLNLADEFKVRGMRDHLDLLRGWYRDYRGRSRAAMRERKPPWTEQMVLEWLCILGVPPFESALPTLARGVRACACTQKEAGLPQVACVFPPDGCVWECAKCGARWVERTGARSSPESYVASAG